MTNVQKAYDVVYRDNEFTSNLVVESLNYDGGLFFDMHHSDNNEPFLFAQFGGNLVGLNASSLKD